MFTLAATFFSMVVVIDLPVLLPILLRIPKQHIAILSPLQKITNRGPPMVVVS